MYLTSLAKKCYKVVGKDKDLWANVKAGLMILSNVVSVGNSLYESRNIFEGKPIFRVATTFRVMSPNVHAAEHEWNRNTLTREKDMSLRVLSFIMFLSKIASTANSLLEVKEKLKSWNWFQVLIILMALLLVNYYIIRITYAKKDDSDVLDDKLESSANWQVTLYIDHFPHFTLLTFVFEGLCMNMHIRKTSRLAHNVLCISTTLAAHSVLYISTTLAVSNSLHESDEKDRAWNWFKFLLLAAR
ncbi:hypothetical protein RHSIM_Rhsim07G0195800 [Rhododendron simsii]|uniref:Uncharacterized protein n=1 Tax=Rhododendron simsii TaxID=118357 RepID=A0A834GSU5_RHOSS|nr:hypothetical protein RHSIM_Rhsim07G0195800 [Rhododendron simsii]